ncbi:hypothetical protein ACFL9S_04895 [Erwinia sp. AnSW2-5]|uniref:hypothetical protein n=1 Tax=Erwinia sp. AnSW2-5 TaxID=3367692 RepID=UPI00385CC720
MAANVIEIADNDYPPKTGISHQIISVKPAIMTAETSHFSTIKNKKAHIFCTKDDFYSDQIIPMAEWYQLT